MSQVTGRIRPCAGSCRTSPSPSTRSSGTPRPTTATRRSSPPAPAASTRSTYAEWAQRTRKLGGVLDTLGISADGRVGTFGWNSQRHLELYFAAPCTGRVLHTLNIRLFPEQLTYIANHAEDEVVFVDRTMLPLLWKLIDTMTTVQHVVVMDDGGDNEIPDDDRDPRLRDAARRRVAGRLPRRRTRTRPPRCATRAAPPATRRVSCTRTARPCCTPWRVIAPNAFGLSAPRRRDAGRPDVPRQRLGHRARRPGRRRRAGVPGRDDAAEGAGRPDRRRGRHLHRRRPDHLAGRAARSSPAATHKLRDIGCGGSAVPKALSRGLPRAGRAADPAGLGHDRDVARSRRPASCSARFDDADDETKAARRARAGMPLFGVEARIVDADTLEPQAWDDTATGELQVRGPVVREGLLQPRRRRAADHRRTAG